MTGRICVDYKRISKIYCSRMEIKKMLEKMKEIIAGQLNVKRRGCKAGITLQGRLKCRFTGFI